MREWLPVISFGSSPIISKILSAANIPVFIALWLPFIFGTFIKPGLQPTRQPPGNVNLGRL